jgi:hypothetical protein
MDQDVDSPQAIVLDDILETCVEIDIGRRREAFSHRKSARQGVRRKTSITAKTKKIPDDD